MPADTLALSRIEEQQRSFVVRVYGWMAFALAVTAGTAWVTVSTPALVRAIAGNQLLFFGLIIAELGLVMYLSAAIQRMSVQAATGVFIGYSALNGLTLSIVFLTFTAESLVSTFLITGGTFAVVSVWGYVTKTDLTSLGNLFMMGLVGFILASVVNMFIHSEAIYWITTYLGIAIFVGLIAYDTQKLKQMSSAGGQGEAIGRKVAIIGALRLYLDFINLFLLLLRLFGRRR